MNSPFKPTKSAIAANKYGIARSNLLLVILFTLINSVISFAHGNFYFLFSASIPYYVASFSAAWAYSPEDIGLEPAANPTAILVIGAVIAAVLDILQKALRLDDCGVGAVLPGFRLAAA